MTEKHEYYPDSSLFSASLEKVMGTRFFILLLGKEERQASELWEEVRSLLESGDSVFNRFSSESEVSKVNALLRERGEALLSDVLARSVADCVEFRRRTSGLFDITKDSKKELAIEGNVLRAEGAELDYESSRIEGRKCGFRGFRRKLHLCARFSPGGKLLERGLEFATYRNVLEYL